MASSLNRKPRSDVDRANDLIIMGRLFLRGATTEEVVATLNTPDRLIPYAYTDAEKDKKYLSQVWREDAAVSTEQLKSREKAKLDNLEHAYWLHYDRTDDVRALAGVANVIQTRARIMGLYVPTETGQKDIRVVFAWDAPPQLADPDADIEEGHFIESDG